MNPTAIIMTMIGGMLLVAYIRRTIAQRSPRAVIETLRKVPYLQDLSDQELNHIHPLLREVNLDAEQWLIQENQTGDALYIVLRGKLQITRMGAIDQTFVNNVKAGDIIGEMSLLTGERRIASAQAITAVRLLKVAKSDFQKLMARLPDLANTIWGACDIHSIDLMMRDEKRFLRMDGQNRSAWIDSRKRIGEKNSDTTKIETRSFLAIINGRVKLNGDTLITPVLVLVQPGDEVTCQAADRAYLINVPSDMETSGIRKIA